MVVVVRGQRAGGCDRDRQEEIRNSKQKILSPLQTESHLYAWRRHLRATGVRRGGSHLLNLETPFFYYQFSNRTGTKFQSTQSIQSSHQCVHLLNLVQCLVYMHTCCIIVPVLNLVSYSILVELNLDLLECAHIHLILY